MQLIFRYNKRNREERIDYVERGNSRSGDSSGAGEKGDFPGGGQQFRWKRKMCRRDGSGRIRSPRTERSFPAISAGAAAIVCPVRPESKSTTPPECP